MAKKKNKGIPWYIRLSLNIVVVLVLVISIVITFRTAFNSSYEIVTTQVEKENDPNVKEVKIEIKRGDTTQAIAQTLYENDLITSKLWFRAQSKLYKYDGKYKEGVFSLNTTMDDKRMMQVMTTDKAEQVDNIKITIPEGFNVAQIATRLEEMNIVSKDEFIKAVNEKEYDYEFLKNIPLSKKYKLEGYLFPDTYFIRKDSNAEEIVIKMLNRFEEITNKYKQELTTLGYSFDEVITIASIIEQEAKLEEERAIIGGVMYNRLKDNMKLQMCSTVQYALEKKKANLSYEDLEVESPYNTYKYGGLPAGPICSPGEASIKAAFQPEEHNYYFFVVKDIELGSHAFSSTANEHNQNKSKYKQSIDKNFHQ